MRRPGAEIGVSWYADILMRLLLAVLGILWIVLMFNILPGKDNYLAYVGRNTMPVYILHLVVRQWIKKHGITMGLFALPAAGTPLYYVLVFGLASLCVIVFSSKPISKAYDFVVDGLYTVFMRFVKNLLLPPFAALEKLLALCGAKLLSWTEKQKTREDREESKRA